MTTEVERKLAIILSADVYGFSRLMSRDEAGTLALLNAYLEAMKELIRRHQGRVVNSAGDSVLAEFASPVMAVQCAVAVQRQISERNQKLEPERQMWFRIGINLGDVIVEADDIFGDDVNIAARLQGMAEPGGVLISGTVFDQVKHKLTLGFDFLGPQHLKNIGSEVPVYRAVLQAGPAQPQASAGNDAAPQAKPPEDKRPIGKLPADKRHRLIIDGARTAVLIVLFIAINLFTWDGDLWFQWPTLGVLVLFAFRALSILKA